MRYSTTTTGRRVHQVPSDSRSAGGVRPRAHDPARDPVVRRGHRFAHDATEATLLTDATLVPQRLV